MDQLVVWGGRGQNPACPPEFNLSLTLVHWGRGIKREHLVHPGVKQRRQAVAAEAEQDRPAAVPAGRALAQKLG